MTEPAKRRTEVGSRSTVIVLVVGAVIMIATALWLEPRGRPCSTRWFYGASVNRPAQYVTEHRKPAVPKLKAPL